MTLYVKGFDPETSHDRLFKYFEGYGKVTFLKVYPGYAILSYGDRMDARKAKDAAYSSFFAGKILKVEYLEPKELRQLHNEELFDKKQYAEKKNQEMLHTPLNEL